MNTELHTESAPHVCLPDELVCPHRESPAGTRRRLTHQGDKPVSRGHALRHFTQVTFLSDKTVKNRLVVSRGQRGWGHREQGVALRG